MKIKTKKMMNLPQLIEWGFKNDIKNKSYKTNDTEGYELYFDEYGTPRFSNIVNKNDTFTVTVEEEITEDTEIQEMLLIFNNGVTHLVENRSLNYLDTSCLKSAYTMNDDLRLILIWRDGKLVE